MCIYEGREFKGDCGRIIRKYDIYVCNLGDMDETGVLGKTRPCVIVQSDKHLNPKTLNFIVAPIRTEHSMEVNKDTLEDIINSKKEVGRLYVPLESEENVFRFIDMTQLRVLPSSKIKIYKHSILNEEVKRKINSVMYDLLMGDDEYAYIETNKEDTKLPKVEPVEDKQIILLDTSSLSKNTEMGEKISATIEKDEKSTAKLPKNFNEIYVKVKNGRMTTQKASIELGMDVYSFNKLMQDYEKEKSKLSNNTNKGSDEVKEKPKYVKQSKSAIPNGFSLYYKKYKNKQMTVKEIADKLGKHVSTVYSYIYRYEELQVAK